MKKSFRINGSNLNFSQIKSKKESEFYSLATFLEQYYSAEPTFMVSTSGSTGVPEPIKLPKKNMRASAQATLNFLRISAGDTALLALSPDHIGGIMMLVRWVEGDLNLVLSSPKANPIEETEDIIDFAALVPYQVYHSYTDLHKIKKLIIGGGPINPELEKRLQEVPTQIWHTYGMTETISHIALRKVNGEDKSNIFKALPSVTFDVSSNGCLVISAPYIGVEKLQTKDVVELQNEHAFIFKGRLDNVINSGGIKLHPEEIEGQIGDLGYDYFLTGVRDPELGERLVLVTDNSKANLSVLDHIKLGKYQKPKEILVVPKIEKTPTGKIKRIISI